MILIDGQQPSSKLPLDGPILASEWELLGFKRHTQQDQRIGYVFVRAISPDHSAALGTAVLIAQRLINSRALGMAKVFVMHPTYTLGVRENRSPIARADYLPAHIQAQMRFRIQPSAWLLQRGHDPHTHKDDVVDLGITASAIFSDAAVEVERVCPTSGNCQYGMTGW